MSWQGWSGTQSSGSDPYSFSMPSSPVSETANYNLVLEPVTLSENPADAANYWGACFQYTAPWGAGHQDCIGPGAGCGGSTSPCTFLIPYGSVITYICTAGWNGSGGYTSTGWSTSWGYSTGNGCPSTSITQTTVTGGVSLTASYTQPLYCSGIQDTFNPIATGGGDQFCVTLSGGSGNYCQSGSYAYGEVWGFPCSDGATSCPGAAGYYCSGNLVCIGANGNPVDFGNSGTFSGSSTFTDSAGNSCSASGSVTVNAAAPPPPPTYYDDDNCHYIGSFDCWAGVPPTGYSSYDCASTAQTGTTGCVVVGFGGSYGTTADSGGGCTGTIAIGGSGLVYMISGASTVAPYGAGGTC